MNRIFDLIFLRMQYLDKTSLFLFQVHKKAQIFKAKSTRKTESSRQTGQVRLFYLKLGAFACSRPREHTVAARKRS